LKIELRLTVRACIILKRPSERKFGVLQKGGNFYLLQNASLLTTLCRNKIKFLWY